MNLNVSDLIKTAFEYYDNKNLKYKKYIENNNIYLDYNKSTIMFTDLNDEFKYEVLGIFDNSSKIWIWAWMMPIFSNSKKQISESLLNYGLKLEPKNDPEEYYLKTQLVNSRFLLEDKIQLDIHLALACYLSRNKFKFLYKKKFFLDKDKKKYLIIYYLIL